MKLFCFGLGYSARVLAHRLTQRGWEIAGTCRSAAQRDALAAHGYAVRLFDGTKRFDDLGILAGTTHLLASAPPDADGDPVLRHFRDVVAELGLDWAGYLSTTGVYGDSGGAWVDENAPLRPSGERGRRRTEAEAGWLALWRARRVPVHVFRLAGIYGPGRSPFDAVRNGRARHIDRPGHLFSRIHVEDIATVLEASIARPRGGAVYNVCDDVPASPADVTDYACRLLGREPPQLVSFEAVAAGMTPMARSFWDDNRRVSNARIKEELGVRLRYPDYKTGLAGLLAEESSPLEGG